MEDTLDFLLDDRARIEIWGDVVAGGSNEFHTTVVRLAVGIGSDEGGEERMVDVDEFSGKFFTKPIGEDLHKAGENAELDVFISKDLGDGLEACVFLITIHIDVVEGDVFLFCNVLAVVSVADDGGDIQGKVAFAGTPEDFIEAMAGLCNEDGCTELEGRAAKVPVSLERLAEDVEAADEGFEADVEVGSVDLEAAEEFRI